MKVEMFWNYDGNSDSIVVEGDTIELINERLIYEAERRGWKKENLNSHIIK